MKFDIRLLYLYLFSFIGLLISVIGSVQLVQLGLKVYVFKGADVYEYVKPAMPVPDSVSVSTEEASFQEKESSDLQIRETKRQRQREAASALAMIIVGLPLYLYHWKTIKKENS